MLFRLLTLAALVVLPGCSYLPASLGGTRAPSAPTRPPASSLTFPDLREASPPEVRRVDLPNGLVLYLAEDRRLPLVRAQARIAAGTLLDPADHAGLAAIAATTMRTGGAGALDADALNLTLESVGASVEAYASDDATMVTMRTLTESLDTVLPLFAAVLMAPRFEAEPMALAKRQQRSAIARRNDDPGAVAQRALTQALYGADSPFARSPEYWTVDAVSHDDLRAWHARHVVPAQTSIAVWGDFDAEAMAARLADTFGGWTTPAGWTAETLPEVPAPGAGGVVFVDRPDLNQTTVLLGHLGRIRADHPDLPALIVMNEILGGGFSGRLLQRVRTELGLAYSVYGDYGADYDRPGLFVSGTSTRSDATVEATQAVLDVIRGLRTAPPTDDEMRLAQESYLNRSVFDSATPAAVLGRRQTLDAYGYPEDFVESVRARVRGVTPEDVQRVAAEYLAPEAATIVVVGHGAAFDGPLTALGTVDTLDTTIPLVPPGGTAVAGDPDGGRAALDALAERLGGASAFDALRAYRAVGETRATVGGNEVMVGSTLAVRVPARDQPREALRLEQRLPTASVTLIVAGDDARVVTPVGSQAAPPEVVEQVRAQQFLHLAVLLARRADLAPERMPSADGTLVVLRVPGVAAPYTLTLAPDETPLQIATGETVVRLEDWRGVDGLRLPFRYVQTTGGEPAAITQLATIELNPTLADALFDAD